MMIPPRRIKHALDVTVQRLHEADAGEHRFLGGAAASAATPDRRRPALFSVGTPMLPLKVTDAEVRDIVTALTRACCVYTET